jgi:glycosyltransferase involved in cell wall biosynthesis
MGRMKIAQIAPCWIPVPPPGYGGIELVVGLLTDELVAMGHEVTLFASGGSKTDGRLVSYYEIPPGTAALVNDSLTELPHVLNAYSMAGEFDVIHDHSAPLGCSIGAHLAGPPVVHTIHGPLFDERAREIYGLIHERIALVTISDFQRQGAPHLQFAATVYNGIDVGAFPFQESKSDYLLFVGRSSQEKGTHLAVQVARELGRKLVMALKIAEPEEHEYFDTIVRPMLTDGVEILTELNFEEKVRLYADAACTLMPIQWPEPFGLVMTESMACGTPVVALRNGSVPEVVDDGVTGFVRDDLEGFIGAVSRAGEIDPRACRTAVEERFSAAAMAASYEALYSSVTR